MTTANSHDQQCDLQQQSAQPDKQPGCDVLEQFQGFPGAAELERKERQWQQEQQQQEKQRRHEMQRQRELLRQQEMQRQQRQQQQRPQQHQPVWVRQG